MKAQWIAFALAVPLAAHDLYLMPQKFQANPGEQVLVTVNSGDAFPMSEGATDPRRIADARISPGAPIAEFMSLGRATHGFAKLDGEGFRFLSLSTQPNSIEVAPAKFESYLKEEGLQSASEWRAAHGEASKPGREMYTKYAKSLLVSGSPDGGYKSVLGLDIEFVLEANPLALKPGEALPVQVLWRGKPAAGLQVESAWANGPAHDIRVVGRTDAQGRIQVPIQQLGKWRLHAVAMERCPKPELADWQSYWASLTFEVK